MASTKKIISNILILLAVIILIAQFFRPEENYSEEITKDDLTKVETVPAEVNTILKTSCYDCHSDTTNYPWYNSITPVNYYLADHIEHGKHHLNFSEWGKLSQDRKNHKLEETKEMIEDGEMPLESYLRLHHEAKLTEKQVAMLTTWVDNYLAEH